MSLYRKNNKLNKLQSKVNSLYKMLTHKLLKHWNK